MSAVGLAHILEICYVGPEKNACTWLAYPKSQDFDVPSPPPSPPRLLKRKKKLTRATKKKVKTLGVAIPVTTSSAELDATIDAAADEGSEEAIKQKVISHLLPFQPSASSDQPLTQFPVPDLAPSPATNKELPQISEALILSANLELKPQQPIVHTSLDLQNLFSFDIGRYVDPAEVNPNISQVSPLSDGVKSQLKDILPRLNFPIETLINDVGPIISRIEEIQTSACHVQKFLT
uniref:DUF1409 domain-containing protein n=1 Tax=Oryza brachyantha TaxID=4533 RepID=J3N7U7_ORYBR